MNRYYVKIDGQEAPESYTYEELRSMGVLEYDDIQVRKMLDANWYSAKYFDFPEATDVVIDEFGQIHNIASQSDIQIDEFGQIRGVTSNSSSSSNRTDSGSSNSDNGVATFFNVIATIAIIAGTIAIGVGTGGWGAPLAYVAWKSIEALWKED